MANLDIGEEAQRGWKMWIATGDIPAFFYRLPIPLFISCYFGFPGVTPNELADHLIKLGWTGKLPNRDHPHLGFQIAPMGWSWDVWIAQVTIIAVTVPAPLENPTVAEEVRRLTRERVLLHGDSCLLR